MGKDQLWYRLAEALNNRGNVRLARKDNSAAIEDYNAALRLNPAYAEAYGNRALARQATGGEAAARADLQQAVTLHPSPPGPVRPARSDGPGSQQFLAAIAPSNILFHFEAFILPGSSQAANLCD